MKSNTILLVEDNPDDIELTLRALKRNHVANEIEVARDGEQALQYLKDPETPLPKLVLLDLKLPKINGIEVLKVLRADEDLKLLPVVVLTSSNEERDLAESYSNGANSYVRKPVDFEQFMDSVKHLGLYWLLLNEPPPERRVRS
jgi:two-component system response regulator